MTTHPPPTRPAAALVTVSYRGDLDLARDLCASVDAYLDPRVEHVLVVPRSDASLFEPFLTERRRIVLVEDVLPPDYRRLPLPQQLRFGPLRKRIRETWWTPRGLVRGWIIQQVVKLSAPNYISAPSVTFADSDVVLVAPLELEELVDACGTRFYAVPGATADSAMHARWHSVAQRLLGIPVRGYSGSDYIGNLITWRTADILALQDRVGVVAGKRWDEAVIRQRAFSEYILYGVFVDHVRFGVDARPTTVDLVHAGWFYDLATTAGIEEFISGVTGSPVGVAIQSTERFTLAERRDIVGRISSRMRP
ncbi:DUF6492 family protein [Microbacterium sp. P04]|uniref:DUF6492 family protein n=1 Tax=Microbacterium sp. P04 TaxID=3366947 RepID=UPI00374558F2